jgi:hypothetical protein
MGAALLYRICVYKRKRAWGGAGAGMGSRAMKGHFQWQLINILPKYLQIVKLQPRLAVRNERHYSRH